MCRSQYAAALNSAMSAQVNLRANETRGENRRMAEQYPFVDRTVKAAISISMRGKQKKLPNCE